MPRCGTLHSMNKSQFSTDSRLRAQKVCCVIFMRRRYFYVYIKYKVPRLPCDVACWASQLANIGHVRNRRCHKLSVLKRELSPKINVAYMIELLLKSFFGVSLAYVRSLEGSQKAG